MKKIEISKGWLEHEYVGKGRTYQQIAAALGCSKDTVMSRAKEYGIQSRNSGCPRSDILGKKFNSLEVLSAVAGGRHVRWLCRCDCGNEVILYASSLFSGQKGCWVCRNHHIGEANWRGHGEISGEFWGRIKRAARERNYEFSISISEAWDLFLKQERKCALTGLRLIFTRHRADRAKTTASLDRIDSEKGYIKGNIQWVHKDINWIKMDMHNDRFIELCELVAAYARINN